MGSIEALKAPQTCQGALQEETAGVRSVIGAKRLILRVIPCELKLADRSRSSFEIRLIRPWQKRISLPESSVRGVAYEFVE